MKKFTSNVKKNNYKVKKTNNSKKDIFAYILLVLFIFWTVGSLCAFVLTARSCKDDSVITASAEYVQPTDFESANLFPLKYKSGNLVRDGFTLVVNDNGSITLNGTTSSQIIWYFTDVKGSLPYGLEVGETYTLSCSTMVSGRIVLYANYWSGSSWNNAVWTVSSDFVSPRKTIPNTWQGLQQYFIIYANQTFDNETFYPMLTKGSTLYPFQPNYEYFYNQGESDGYESGRADGIMKGNISFLYDSTVTATYTQSGILYSTETGQTTVVGEQVYLTAVADQLPSNATGIDVRIDLSTPTLGRDIYWTAYGNRSAFYDGDTPKVFTAVMSDGSRYNARWYYLEDDQCYGLQVQDVGYDVYLSYLSGWYIGSLTDMKSVYFRAPDSAYRSGFDMGYNAGLEDNTRYNEAYQNGINAGYTNGYAAGKNYGIELANTYSFESLLSAVFDVPIKAFRGLTNFEILGVNLSGFYLSLLTACFVLVIVKIVM